MSKHPSDNTKRSLLRRSLSGILALALVLGLLPSTIATAHAASWADSYVQTLVDWGVMRGDVGGNMAPDRSITRAEFVTMMNRAYGYTRLGSNPFTDVNVRDWYYEDINIAYNIGYFQGTSPTTAAPNASLTREQAAVLLARNMVLQPTVGETLGFSDTRTLSDWSRGLVGAAAENGIISGYEDGSFRPSANITRGEVAAMLVRAIGTPIQSAGDHTLGNVYGNVTVNTSGVKLRDGVIAGNLYLTGGIDLGDILLENVTVLGEIIVSGGGESDSAQSSIIMRNVVADNMVVDSIGGQFITIRAEGNTDIPTATVRTSAYVDDSSLPGYGLSFITLDGEEGSLYQLAGNIKEVLNKTPGSDLQVVQGTANKVTVDEYATGSKVLVDGDAVVGDLNLDVGTDVTGTGDIKNLNVGAAGSTVEQLPDSIDIRPGITTDIAGSTMDSTQASESSSDPKLLAGYPAVRKIAPTSAELVFRTNKSGTIYWAVSAVADGSVSEADLLDPPAYGNKVIASGKVTAASANTDYTAAVSRLTSGGSYYVTAMLVDGRDQHSPIKVTSFATPDNTVPAFASGYPIMTKITCEEAQATVMTTKSCLLYYALLPQGAAAPTPEEFKSAAIPGNLGYGSMSVTKNVTIPFPVNSVTLDEKTPYVLYLWLTDHDGAQSAPSVTRLPFTTPDETPPNVTSIMQTDETPTTIKVEYTIDEPASLVWAIVTEGDHMAKRFLDWTDENFDPNDEDKSTLTFGGDAAALLAAQIRLLSGTGALASGSNRASPLNITGLDSLKTNTSSYVLYYIANDNATASGNLSTEIRALRVHTEDNIKPTVSLRFANSDGTEVTEDPQADADIHIIFSENVKATTTKGKNIFLNLYNDVQNALENLENANINGSDDDKKDAQADYDIALSTYVKALSDYITLYSGVPDGTHNQVPNKSELTNPSSGIWIDWTRATVEMMDDGTGRVQIILPGPTANADGSANYDNSAVKLDSGSAYYFHLAGIYDLAMVPNPLDPSPCDLIFTTSFAQVQLEVTSHRPAIISKAVNKQGGTLFTNGSTATNTVPTTVDPSAAALYPYAGQNDPARIDRSFRVQPLFNEDNVDHNVYYDILIWADTNMEITLYSRTYGSDEDWVREGSTIFRGVSEEAGGYVYRSLFYNINGGALYSELYQMKDREYAIHVDQLRQIDDLVPNYSSWSGTVNMKVSVIAGWSDYDMDRLSQNNINFQETYDRLVPNTLRSIGVPDPFPLEMTFTDTQPPSITNITIVESDTSPSISIMMDHPGAVNYVVFPLTDLQYSNGGALQSIPSGTQITDEMIRGTADKYNIASYNAPTSIRTYSGNATSATEAQIKDITPIRNGTVTGTPLGIPTTDQVIDGFTNTVGVTKGRTDFVSANMTASIELKGLEANTIYLLLAVPQGTTAESYAERAVAYRFITQMPSRPVISLQGSTTDVTATVDRTSVLRARLLGQDQLLTAANSIFSEQLSKYLDTNAAATLPTEYADFNILRALYTSVSSTYGSPGRNGQYPSVFDVYANQDAKQTVQQVVESGGALSNASVGDWGGEGHTVTVTGTSNSVDITFNTDDLFANTDYVCIAMARSSSSGAYAFRAIYPLQVLANQPPTIVPVGTLVCDETTKLVSGTISINFSQPLYRQNSDKKLVPVKQDGTLTANSTYGGIGGAFQYAAPLSIIPAQSADYAPISSVSFNVAETNLSSFQITVQASVFRNQWGTNVPGGIVTVSINKATGAVTANFEAF